MKNGVFLSSHHFYISDFPCFSSVKRRFLISVRRAFVAGRMLKEQIRVRTEFSSSCLSYATNTQRTSGGNFLFPLLSLASLLSLSYAFLNNSMFSLGFSLFHLFLQKRKRVDEIQKSLSHTYNSKFHQNIYLLIFTLFYVYSYLYQLFTTKNHVHSREIEMESVKL